MAKQDETKTTEAATALYKVTYSYLSKEGFIRTGSIVIDTNSAEKAKEEATTRLTATNFRHIKIGKVTTY